MKNPDYEGDMSYYQKQLEEKGITKDMLNMDMYVGLTAMELQSIVDHAHLRKKEVPTIPNIEKRKETSVETTKWVLGEDMNVIDNIFDSITFLDLITAVHCNSRKITPDAVWRELKRFVEQRCEDAKYLVEKNMEQIMNIAREGRQ